MEQTLFNLTPDLKKRLANRKDDVMAFMAINLFMESKMSPSDLILNRLCQNIQEASTWNQIKENQLDFADQVLDMFPENYDETNAFIQEITPLEGEELEKYLREKCGFFFFPSLNIAFSIDNNVVEEFEIKQIA
ncbi:hypothetical protein CVD28_00890 [Bacillus sp. M6-12]|uniref:hypothetical protein n=1 Tax=Bacillus sp. M6-12 TaxID=2054166 RepID=UPI000C773D12|nr:hypothetical protein [Bacillus sp. M6-12]PLS18989.1 hypothetical protein CVD28_00890 [Bacillus sp. M6-12]